MRVGICDDNQEERRLCKGLIAGSGTSVSEYASGEALLAGLENGDVLDLLFLDIYMDGMDGMETAQKIREINKNLPIVYLTASTEFAILAFGVRAVGYLVKPVKPEELLAYVEEYRLKTPAGTDAWVVDTQAGVTTIGVSQVMYYEQRGHYGSIHLDNGTVHQVRATFSEIGQQLSNYAKIVPCGRSFLINLSFVRIINHQDVVMTDGMVVPVPRRAYGHLRRAYMEFYCGEDGLC